MSDNLNKFLAPPVVAQVGKRPLWKTMLRNLAFILPTLLGIALVQSRVFPRQSIGLPSTDAACLSPPPDTCTFYADCLESRYHCGPTGYPIGYGQRFCGEFVGNKSLLDTNGQTWMVNTMHCLQLALVSDAVDANATTCQALETQAFDIKTLFDSWDAFKATVEAAGDCAAFIAWMVAKGLF